MLVDERERRRRRRLVRAHVDAENAHDIEAIMATFSPHALGVLNGDVSTTPEAIRRGHVLFGMSDQPGILSGLEVVPEVEHFTEDEIVYEGQFRGVHTGAAPGIPAPSQQAIALPYVVIYRFDSDGLLVSERARVDFSPLFKPQPAPSAP